MANEWRRRCGWTRSGRARPSRRGSEDEERSGAGERAALRVEEQLGPVAAVEVRAAAREIAAERLGGVAPERHDPFLAALADHPHEAVVEVDAGLIESHRLGDAEPRAVQELDERVVAQRARRASRPQRRSAARPRRATASAGARARLGERELGRRVVGAGAEQLLVAEEVRAAAVAARSSRPRGRRPAACLVEARGSSTRRLATGSPRNVPERGRGRDGMRRPFAASDGRPAARGSPRPQHLIVFTRCEPLFGEVAEGKSSRLRHRHSGAPAARDYRLRGRGLDRGCAQS